MDRCTMPTQFPTYTDRFDGCDSSGDTEEDSLPVQCGAFVVDIDVSWHE